MGGNDRFCVHSSPIDSQYTGRYWRGTRPPLRLQVDDLVTGRKAGEGNPLPGVGTCFDLIRGGCRTQPAGWGCHSLGCRLDLVVFLPDPDQRQSGDEKFLPKLRRQRTKLGQPAARLSQRSDSVGPGPTEAISAPSAIRRLALKRFEVAVSLSTRHCVHRPSVERWLSRSMATLLAGAAADLCVCGLPVTAEGNPKNIYFSRTLCWDALNAVIPLGQ